MKYFHLKDFKLQDHYTLTLKYMLNSNSILMNFNYKVQKIQNQNSQTCFLMITNNF